MLPLLFTFSVNMGLLSSTKKLLQRKRAILEICNFDCLTILARHVWYCLWVWDAWMCELLTSCELCKKKYFKAMYYIYSLLIIESLRWLCSSISLYTCIITIKYLESCIAASMLIPLQQLAMPPPRLYTHFCGFQGKLCSHSPFLLCHNCSTAAGLGILTWLMTLKAWDFVTRRQRWTSGKPLPSVCIKAHRHFMQLRWKWICFF